MKIKGKIINHISQDKTNSFEKELEEDFQSIVIALVNVIKKKVLELSVKFSRLQINEIQEKCGVSDENVCSFNS